MLALEKFEFLQAAMCERKLIRLSRRFENFRMHGYVVAMSQKFLAVAVVSDRIRFDGFDCFRISDISKPQLEPYASFIEKALVARGEVRPPCSVDVTDIASILTTASAAFPLIAIHEERLYPDECRIGRLQSLERGWMTLLEINPDATWDEEPTRHRLRDITRVSFDGDYERALHLVGQDPA